MGFVLTLLRPRKASVFDLRRKHRITSLSSAAVGFALLLICNLGLGAAPAAAADEARRLVALLDYLGSDYKNSVQDGKIASEDEYGEMQEFAKRSLDLLVQLKKSEQGDKAGIELDLKTLAKHVENKDDSLSGYYLFANSALIILREGLEAALILAAIIAMLKVMGATEAIRYIHLGWMLALVAGGLTWLATETVLTLSGRHRESMEGFISVFAAIALFYVGYWLHTRSEVRKWRDFIEQKVRSGISTRRVLGLTGISFFAVYREAFEVVLFYQALWLQNEGNHGSILWGIAGGFAALILAAFAILKLGLKMPLKYFFGATGTLLYILAFIFAGNGVKELQAALWLSTTPLSIPEAIPVLGIYPTVETLTAQGLMLCAFLTATFWMARERKKAG